MVAVLRIKHGSTARKVFRYKNPDGSLQDLTGSTFELTIKNAAGTLLLHKKSIDGGLSIDIPAAKVIWVPTTAETRLIPLGRVSYFDIERRIGGNEEPRGGLVEGIGGANVDG